jgi:hypothetical protein
MKKIFFAVVVIIVSIFFVSCHNNDKIESIEVDNEEYKTIYLYSFKDAEIDNEFMYIENCDVSPSSCGYVYSSEVLSVGDTINVWTNCFFNSGDSSTIGTYAVVEEIVDTYNVKIEEKKDTYIITYYIIENYDRKTVSEKQELSKIEENKIEVFKERVTIKYKAE